MLLEHLVVFENDDSVVYEGGVATFVYHMHIFLLFTEVLLAILLPIFN